MTAALAAGRLGFQGRRAAAAYKGREVCLGVWVTPSLGECARSGGDRYSSSGSCPAWE
jgi:hypothetical protein